MFDDFGPEYLITILLWLTVLVVLFRLAWFGRRPVVGLALAYWVNLAIIHFLAGLIQLLPWHYGHDRAYTLMGFGLTGYAMAGFLLGQLIPRPKAMARLTPTPLPSWERGDAHAGGPGLAWNLIGWGLGFYFVIIGVMAIMPGLTAILSNGLNISVAGFCLLFWHYYKRGQRSTAWLMVAWVLLLPALTVILRGFLGYGILAMVTVGTFVAVKYIPRRTIVLGGIVLFFLGLSLYTSYMSVRSEIRASVWGGETFAENLLATSSIEKKWTWADLGSSNQLDSIENRLNQNALVGAARYNIESRKVNLAEGETIWQALLALIPRAIWPDKPQFAGSGGALGSSRLVSRFTGIHFDGSTSVGIGHVMELYVNFGEWGLFAGFVIIGYVLALIDERAGQHLHFGNMEGFLVWFVGGQTLLMVGGNFAELTPAAVGAVILCLFLSRIVLASWMRRPMQARPSSRL